MSSRGAPYSIYIDLDRTLFRTNELPLIIEEFKRFSPKIVPEKFLSEQTKYYVETDVGYYYDMSAHLRAYQVDPDAMYRHVCASKIADNRFLFPGGEALAEWLSKRGDVAILTYGSDDYQRFKAALCPALAAIPVITTLEDKAVWFHREVKVARVVMIDDKPIGKGVPSNVDFIQVQLEGKPSAWAYGWPVLDSLDEVLEELRRRDRI